MPTLMSDSFNPYCQWLGLPAGTVRPSHYELLGLSAGEADPKRIAVAAEQAATKIRSFRPGKHASDWARLLDEVQAAKIALLDPARKSEHDQKSGGKSTANSTGNATHADLFPPGFRGAGAAAIAPPSRAPRPTPAGVTPQPTLVATADPWNTLPPAAQDAPMMPPGCSASPALPVAQALSAGMMPAPVYGQPQYGAVPIDPMAPVAIPGVTVGAAYMPVAVPAGYPTGAAYPAMPAAVPLAQPFAPQAAYPTAMAAPAPAGESPAPEMSGVRKASAASVMMAARKERQTRHAALLAGAGAGLVIVSGLVAYVVMTSKGNQEHERRIAQANTPGTDSKPLDKNRTAGKPAQENKAAIPAVPATNNSGDDSASVQPMPSPDPAPVPEPTPTPEPKPEPPPVTREPKPDPIPKVKPTRQQVVELEASLKRARLALSEQSFDEAESHAAHAAKAAVTPDHQALVERLRLAIDHAKLFRQALAEAIGKLEAAETIKVGKSTVISIVETSRDKITIRMNGGNRAFSFASIPPGLAVAILDTKRMGGQPDTRLLKAMIVATAKDADTEAVADARGWLKEMEGSDDNAAKLLSFLDDSYDGLVTAFDKDEKNAAAASATAGTSN